MSSAETRVRRMSAGALVGALLSSSREVTDALTSLAALGQSIDPDSLAAGDEAFPSARRQANLGTEPQQALRRSVAQRGKRAPRSEASRSYFAFASVPQKGSKQTK
jgi:hypothetical protein